MAWKLDGTYFENCSCDVLCPCGASSLVLPADKERCQVVLAYHVDSGEIDGVDVSDRTIVVVADTPAQMSDGNWRLGVFIDASASDEQAAKLGGVFSGALGGPMEALGPLVGENLGVLLMIAAAAQISAPRRAPEPEPSKRLRWMYA